MGDSLTNEREDELKGINLEMEDGYNRVKKHGIFRRGSRAICCCLALAVFLVAIASISGLILGILQYHKCCKQASMNGSAVNNQVGSSHMYDQKIEGSGYAPDDYNADEIWTIHMAVDDGNLEYIDDITGTIKGYNIDIVNAVCRKANKNCQIVLGSYSRCWSGGYGGDGLMSRWYHACTGWRITRDRQLTFKFTDPFQQEIATVFVTRSGADQFDWTNLSGKKIGFWEGWFSDPGCLNRQSGIQGLPLEEDQVVMYETSAALELALSRKEIDAAFVGTDVDFVSRNVISSDEIQCSVEGGGMMMRKDTHLERWWNPAWRALLASDEYQDICDDIERVHGHKPGLGKEDLCRKRDEDFMRRL